MTLYELWLVVKRRWKLMVALPIVCALACGAWLLVSREDDSYQAVAKVVANSQLAYVAGEANAQAAILYGDEDSEIKVTAKADSGNMTVSVIVTGPDPEELPGIANSFAREANKAAENAFADFENAYKGRVDEAEEPEPVEGASGGLKYLLVVVLGGLLAAACIAVMLDLKHRPVMTPDSMQDSVELPVLEKLPAASGERLLANVRFASGSDDPGSVLVIPSGDPSAADDVAALLKEAVAYEGADLPVEVATPLSEGMSGAYAARSAGIVVVTARQWIDTLTELESTVAELRLAGAKIAGTVFMGEGK